MSFRSVTDVLRPAGFEIVRHSQFNAENRAAGLDFPPEAETMIGMVRYESTMDALVNLYPKLSIGGYVIIDDYFLDCCRSAVNEFRQKEKIEEPCSALPTTMGAFWKRAF